MVSRTRNKKGVRGNETGTNNAMVARKEKKKCVHGKKSSYACKLCKGGGICVSERMSELKP